MLSPPIVYVPLGISAKPHPAIAGVAQLRWTAFAVDPVHVPPTHVSLDAQARPQAPQCAVLVLRLRQVPLQLACPV